MAGATEDHAVRPAPELAPGLSEPPPSTLGPALTADGAIAGWVQHAMARAEQDGIDPRRVAVALGIPLRAFDRDV